MNPTPTPAQASGPDPRSRPVTDHRPTHDRRPVASRSRGTGRPVPRSGSPLPDGAAQPPQRRPRPVPGAPRPRPDRGRQEPGVLRAAEEAFVALCTGPRPLALHGRGLAGLPPTLVPLTRLRQLLLDRSVGPATRHAVWTQILDRARSGRPEWVLAAVGLAMPGLAGMAARLRTSTDADGADLEAELLTGFLTALRDLDPGNGRIAARLCWAAYRAADSYRRAEPARSGRVSPLPGSASPPRPYGHPDLVLADLTARGVLSTYEAELIAATRLEGARLEDLSAAWGVPASTLTRDRSRAEARLLDTLTTDGKVTVRPRSATGVVGRAPESACPGARTSCPPPTQAPAPAA
jgi:hypothetical protein